MPRKQSQPQQGSNEPVVTPEVTPQAVPQETPKAAEAAPQAAVVEKSEPPKAVASNPASPKPIKVVKLPNGVTIETF